MKNIRTSIREHKKLFCIMGLVFVVCLECCVFPVGSSTLGGNSISIFINFATVVAIGKCVGEIEVIMFPKAAWLAILLLNFGITIMGMVVRYFLEYGEVSNTYNFTFKKVIVHMVIMLLFSMMFWVQTNKELKDERDEN